jgi:CelD/BcsL family acetyltransferase involved in cellulose biosynthesis
MANDDIRIELVTQNEQLRDLRASWETLWARTPGARWSQHPAMCGMTIEAAQRTPGRRLSMLTARRGPSLVGILPLVTWSTFFISFFAPPAIGILETSSALLALEENADQLTRSMLGHLTTGALGSVVRLPHLRGDTPFGAAILKRRDALALGSIPFSEMRRSHCGAWEEHLASKTGKEQLRTYRKRRRQLGDIGDLQYGTISAYADKIVALEWLFKTKKEWIAREGKKLTPFFSDENFTFISQQLNTSDSVYGLSIYKVTLDERIIAVQLVSRGADLLELVAVAHDKDLNKYSVGRFIVELVTSGAIAENLDVDLGFGDEQWKGDFRTHRVNTYGVNLLAGSTAVLLPVYKAVSPLYVHGPRLGRWASRQLRKFSALTPGRLVRPRRPPGRTA